MGSSSLSATKVRGLLAKMPVKVKPCGLPEGAVHRAAARDLRAMVAVVSWGLRRAICYVAF